MTEPHAPRIEVIIPVHDAARPLGRALSSIRGGAGLPPDALAITVVCHNVPVKTITKALDESVRARVTFLSCDDGRNSPAGPRSLALAATTAEYVSFLDSDDWLEPGALAAWLAAADRHAARTGIPPAAMIAPERRAAGSPVLNPPTRPFRRLLHPRRDRLPYRSAVRGLYSVAAARELGIGFGTAPGNGSDLAFSLGYWYSGRPVVFAARTPAYVLGDDAGDRVTRAPRPLDAELAACTQLLEGSWLASLPLPDRQLVAAKFVRAHLLPGLVARADGASAEGLARHAADAARFLALAARAAPGYAGSLSLREVRLADAAATPSPDLLRLGGLAAGWARFRPFSMLATRRPGDLLRLDAPPRWVTAMLLLLLRMRRPARVAGSAPAGSRRRPPTSPRIARSP